MTSLLVALLLCLLPSALCGPWGGRSYWGWGRGGGWGWGRPSTAASPTLQQCDVRVPCGDGQSCQHSRKVPGVKACAKLAGSSAKRSGRCPPVGGGVFGSFSCAFDSDCLDGGTRCCETSTGVFACVRPLQIPGIDRPKVTVLLEGALDFQPTGMELVLGSSLLVQSRGKNVLFETGGFADKVSLLRNLRNEGLYPDDVDFVVTSHGHPDHYANINLFPDAPQNFDRLTGTDTKLLFNGFASGQPVLVMDDPSMEIIRTPGHTPQDTSLIVRDAEGFGTVAAVGDLILLQGVLGQPGAGCTQEQLDASQKTVICLADWILPGHGPMFPVTQQMKNDVGPCP